MTIDSGRIFKIYKSLDKDQLQFVFDKKITGSLSLGEWLAKLRKIAEMDTIGDETRKRSGNMAILFGILTVLTIILTLARPMFFFLPVGFFIVFLYLSATYFLLRKIDIGNNLRLFIVPVLEHFESKGSLDKALDLNMDFSNPVKDEHLTGTIEEEKESPVNIYRHHWMEGKMEFTDGVRITWEIEDVVKRMESEKKLSLDEVSGNYVIQHTLNMHFRAPKDRFSALNKEMMETDDGKYYIVSFHKKDISENLDEGMSPEVFISSVTEGYSYVHEI